MLILYRNKNVYKFLWSSCHKRFQDWRESRIFDKLGGTRPAKITNILKL